MAITWHAIHDNHRWHAHVGDVLRLHIDPNVSGGELTYDACVYDLNLSLITSVRYIRDVESAKRQCLYLAEWALQQSLNDVRLALGKEPRHA